MDKGSLLIQPGRQATDIAGNAHAAERTLGSLLAVNSDGSLCASSDIPGFVAGHLATNIKSTPVDIGIEQTVGVLDGHAHMLLGRVEEGKVNSS